MDVALCGVVQCRGRAAGNFAALRESLCDLVREGGENGRERRRREREREGGITLPNDGDS